IAYPDRPVIALLGDGAMQMNGLIELETVANSWQSWSDPRLVMLVLNTVTSASSPGSNGRWKASRASKLRSTCPIFRTGDTRKCWGGGIVVQAPEEVTLAWDEARAVDRPVLINAVVDPNVPTLRPQPQEQVLERIAKALAEEPEPDSVRESPEWEGVFV